jgi:hypothetical protein
LNNENIEDIQGFVNKSPVKQDFKNNFESVKQLRVKTFLQSRLTNEMKSPFNYKVLNVLFSLYTLKLPDPHGKEGVSVGKTVFMMCFYRKNTLKSS